MEMETDEGMEWEQKKRNGIIQNSHNFSQWIENVAIERCFDTKGLASKEFEVKCSTKRPTIGLGCSFFCAHFAHFHLIKATECVLLIEIESINYRRASLWQMLVNIKKYATKNGFIIIISRLFHGFFFQINPHLMFFLPQMVILFYWAVWPIDIKVNYLLNIFSHLKAEISARFLSHLLCLSASFTLCVSVCVWENKFLFFVCGTHSYI